MGIFSKDSDKVKLSTIDKIHGCKITEQMDMVYIDVVAGASFLKDFFAKITDFTGGRSKSYEKVFARAKETGLEELKKRAEKMGANGIVGVHFEIQAVGKNGSILTVSVSGTPVKFEEDV